jgi:hypothetical protein
MMQQAAATEVNDWRERPAVEHELEYKMPDQEYRTKRCSRQNASPNGHSIGGALHGWDQKEQCGNQQNMPHLT